MQQKVKASIPASASLKCAPVEEQKSSTLKGEAGCTLQKGRKGKQ